MDVAKKGLKPGGQKTVAAPEDHKQDGQKTVAISEDKKTANTKPKMKSISQEVLIQDVNKVNVTGIDTVNVNDV